MIISRSSAALALVAATALAGCKPASESGNTTAPTPSATPVAQGVEALPEATQLKLAFKAAYGSEGAARITVDDSEVLNIKPGKLLWIGDTAVLLSPGANESDCHACSGTLAIAYLEPKGSGFAVKGKWPALVRGSGWGAEPEWKVSDAFTVYPAVYVESGDTAQGYTCSGASITELKPDGPVQSDRVPLSADNEGAVDDATGKTFGGEPRKNLNGKVVDVVKGKSFAVKVGGTASFVERYEYRDGRFVALQRESRLSC